VGPKLVGKRQGGGSALPEDLRDAAGDVELRLEQCGTLAGLLALANAAGKRLAVEECIPRRGRCGGRGCKRTALIRRGGLD
jgi:hypothetical protein